MFLLLRVVLLGSVAAAAAAEPVITDPTAIAGANGTVTFGAKRDKHVETLDERIRRSGHALRW